MKPLSRWLAALVLAAVARADTLLEVRVSGVPAEATELVFVVDALIPTEGPGYEDPNAPPPVAAPANNTPTPPPRRRFARPAEKPPPLIRGSLLVRSGEPAVWRVTPSSPGERYRVRVAATRGSDAFPVVLAGGKATGLRIETGKTTVADVTLAAPALKLSPENPTRVAPGAPFTFTGVITDPGNFLGTKNRMRVWLSSGAASTANRSGTQISSVDVTTTGEDIAFRFELVAPREPGPLYLQFGELSPDFSRADGTQAPVLLLPDLTTAAPLQLQVLRASGTAAQLRDE